MKPEYWDRAKRALARRDPVMAAIIRSRPKVFLMRRGEPFLTLARAICGQQISVKAAQSVWDRVVACCGEVTPEKVLSRPRPQLRACGLSDRKTEYIADLAGVSYPIALGARRLSVVTAGPVSRCLDRRPDIARIMAEAIRESGFAAAGQPAGVQETADGRAE